MWGRGRAVSAASFAGFRSKEAEHEQQHDGDQHRDDDRAETAEAVGKEEEHGSPDREE